VAPKVNNLEGRALSRRAKAAWAVDELIDAVDPLWRGV
jgi:hypothetical protein